MNAPNETVRKYLGDMLATERHTLEVIQRQIDSDPIQKLPQAHQVLRTVRNLLEGHIVTLRNRLDALGGAPTSTTMLPAAGVIKEAVTNMTGLLSGWYDRVRSEPAARLLRDDYAALHYLSVCYSMLNVTAQACGDTVTAGVAQNHLRDFPQPIVDIGAAVPHAVMRELIEDRAGVVDANCGQLAAEQFRDSWRPNHESAAV